jgi:hypothetical protein
LEEVPVANIAQLQLFTRVAFLNNNSW